MKSLLDSIMKEVQAKMESAAEEVTEAVYQKAKGELENFYNTPDPKQYERTGKLGGAARRTPVMSGGNMLMSRVYLTKGLSYDTGTFSGADVLYCSEYNYAGIIGNGGFWNTTVGELDNIGNAIVGKYFSKI